MFKLLHYKILAAIMVAGAAVSPLIVLPALAQRNPSSMLTMSTEKPMTPEQMHQHHQEMMGKMQQMMGQMQQRMVQMSPEEIRQHHRQMMENPHDMMQQMMQMMEQMNQQMSDTDGVKKDSEVQTGHQMNKSTPE